MYTGYVMNIQNKNSNFSVRKHNEKATNVK